MPSQKTVFISYGPGLEQALKEGKELTSEQKQERQEADALNQSLHLGVSALTRDDRLTGLLRFFVLVILALSTLAGAGIVVLAVIRGGTQIAETVTGGAVFFIAILAAAVINPTQTIERDVVFRRWSDAIVMTFLMRMGSRRAGPREVRAAGRDVSQSFLQLATTYATVSARSTNALISLAKLARPLDDNGSSDDKAGLAITNPGAQKSVVDKALSPALKIETGLEDGAIFAAEGLPAGLVIDVKTGEISGTPTAVGPSVVKVTVTKGDLSVVATFKWGIVAAS